MPPGVGDARTGFLAGDAAGMRVCRTRFIPSAVWIRDCSGEAAAKTVPQLMKLHDSVQAKLGGISRQHLEMRSCRYDMRACPVRWRPLITPTYGFYATREYGGMRRVRSVHI